MSRKNLLTTILFSVLCIATAVSQNKNMQKQNKTEVATFGGGCFWCTEAIFQELEGVISVTSGYAGGKTINPTYEQICTGTTGHAEVIQIKYDPTKIKYELLLDVFFNTHNPTTLNRQGADRGTQYRSVVFYHNESQKEVSKKMIQDLTKAQVFDNPIVTEVTAINNYYDAENYHQDYFANNPTNGYCNAVINPKLTKFMKQYKDKLKK